MRNLIEFILRYNYWFLFFLLEVTSFVLLVRFNNYQGSAYFTSANAVSGTVYNMTSGVTHYFNLKGENQRLATRNIQLEQEVAALRRAYLQATNDTAWVDTLAQSVLRGYTMIQAEVVNNSTKRIDNYITLNKGEADGIRRDMGVIDGNGVIGIVYLTSAHYSVVIPVINKKSSLSCKIKGSDYVGDLAWNGEDSRYVYLKDLPQHAEYANGDTIITSGYSSIFPEGIMVGKVEQVTNVSDGLSVMLRVHLATDFGRLSDVWVISNKAAAEQRALEALLKE